MRAMRAAGPTVEGRPPPTHGAVELELHERRLVGRAALVADAAHQPLRLATDHRRGDHEGLEAHLEEAAEPTDGIGWMQRRENEVARQCRLHGNLGRLLIADLSHEDGVRVLTENGAQPGSKGDPGQTVDLDLVDVLERVLNRIFDRHDVLLHPVELADGGIERGRLAAAGRPGDEDYAVGRLDQLLERLQRGRRKPERVESKDGAGSLEQPEHYLLAPNRFDGADADIEGPAVHRRLNLAVLTVPAVDDIQVRQQLDAR